MRLIAAPHRLGIGAMADKEHKRSIKFYVLSVLALLGVSAAVAYFHVARYKEVELVREERIAIADRGPRIEVVTAETGPSVRVIKLLGDVRAGATTTLYGKVSGYIRAMPVDKGDRVEAGQIVAEIAAAELDQQFASAAADLANKRRNLARIRDLYRQGNTTEVAKFQAETDATMAENLVASLETMKGYQVLRAPYSGGVTQRFVDVGAFITPGATTFASATPILTISDDTRVKVYLYIQQVDAPFVRIGDIVQVADADNPERKRTATLTRMNGELDAKSRTMLAEISLDNAKGFLVPGSFAQVTLEVPMKSYPQIPVTALLTRGNENVVAVLDDLVVRFRPVKVVSTDGATVSIAEGIEAGERVAINVPDEVTNGSRVQPVFTSPTLRSAAVPQ
jgi:RND family efflux transporter MFP subunit